MDRQEFFADQVVEPDDLNSLEDAIERAIGRVIADYLLGAGGGVLSGLVPTETAGPNPAVQVSPGIAYDGSTPPRRISVARSSVVDLSRDVDGEPTSVGSSGARWLTLTVRQAPARYDLRLRADGVEVPFRSDESFAFETFAGDVAATPLDAELPSVPASHVILADWLLTATEGRPIDRRRSFARRVPRHAGSTKLGAREALAQIAALTHENCLVVADSPWSMSVRLLAGRVNVVDGSFAIDGNVIGPLTAPATNPKVVLIYVDPVVGLVQTLDGVEAPEPTPPSHTVGVALAEVLLRPGDTFIDESRIRDVRPFLGLANLRGDLEATSLVVRDVVNQFVALPTRVQLVAGGAVLARLDAQQLSLRQQFLELAELPLSPPAPAVGRVRLFARSNGQPVGQTPPVRTTQWLIKWDDGSETVVAESPPR
jgi:hypothetical protein